MDTEKYTAFRRLEEAVRVAAEERGYSHFDLFANVPLGTLRQELIALDLYVEFPARLRRFDADAAHQWCRAAALSGAWNPKQPCGPMTAPKPAKHPAIARANRAAAAQRAQKRGVRT